MKKASKLTKVERSEIQILIEKGYSHRSMAMVLGRSPNTISSEIKRNSCGYDDRTPDENKGKYLALQASRKSYAKRMYAKHRGMKIENDSSLRSFIILKLKDHWNPEEIAGFLKLHQSCQYGCTKQDYGSGCSGGIKYSSKTSIYEWIYSALGQRYYRYLYLSRHKPKPRKPNKTKRELIPNRVGIEQRSKDVELRIKPGHLEFDSVVSSKRSGSKHAVAVVQDRSTRLIRATIVPSLKPAHYARTIAALVRGLRVRTFTTDNGIENIYHREITKQTKAPVYFTNPYSSWQKGSVENANKMIRRYFPKGTDFAKIKQTDLDRALTLINNKPRKILGYKSSLQLAKEKGLFKD